MVTRTQTSVFRRRAVELERQVAPPVPDLQLNPAPPEPSSPPEAAPPAASQARSVDRGIKAAVALVILFGVWQHARRIRRHTARAVARWWDGVEHQEERRLEDAALGFLLQRLARD